MVLWERSAALDVLEELLRDTARGGRVALVVGEAGIGKSTLVNAFVGGLGSRARVLWGSCDPLSTPRASGPLHDIARQAGGALRQRLDAGGGLPELFGALVDELSAPRQRSVVVVEDAHWADEATHDLLVLLGRRIERLPAMLVVTYRDDEVDAEHPLRGTLAALPRSAVRTVPVPVLSRRCVAEQAVHGGRDPAHLYRLTGGNPLLVTEMLATGGPDVPETVRDLMLGRLRRLSTGGRDVARLVAVMPTGAEAAALVGLEPAVDECLATGVLRSHGDRLSFRHELLRRAVEDSTPPTRRTALHRRALALLTPVAGIDAARLAHHARHAADGPALLRHGIVAARGAAAQGAHREAAAHFRLVRPYLDGLPADGRAAVLEQYANEAYLAGDADEGLRARQDALAERERLGDPGPIGENLRWMSRLHWWNGRGGPARIAAARSIEVLTAGAPGRELAMAYSNLSQLHMLAHDMSDAIDLGERAVTLADRLGDRDTAAHAAINVRSAQLSRGDESAMDALDRLHADADSAGMFEHAARALVCVTGNLMQTCQYERAAAAVERALSYARERHLNGYEWHLLGLRAAVRMEQCDWDGALADADEALGRPVRTGVPLRTALVVRGRIQAARGSDEALSTLDLAARCAHGTGQLQHVAAVAAARAEYFLLVGEARRADDEVGPALALATAKGNQWAIDELAFRRWQATGGDETGPPAGPPSPFRMLMAGEWASAAAAWSERGAGYARIDALSTGDADAAAEALRVLGRLGADRRTQALRADLRRRGVGPVPRGPRSTAAANRANLTGRQLEILGLLADGLSNTDIAERLTLSHRTVEHHVSAVLEKLGASRRGQAVAAARRLNVLS